MAVGGFFDSSTEFILPKRAGRAPDLSWVRNERWDSLTERNRSNSRHVCLILCRTSIQTDRLKTLQAKMEEKKIHHNGAQLGC